MGDAAGMEGSSLAKIFVGGLDRSVDEVRLSKKMSRYISSSFFSLIAFALALILAIHSAWKVLYIKCTDEILNLIRVLYVIFSANSDRYLR